MVEEIPNTADPDLDPVYCAPNEFSKVFDAEKRRIAEAPEGFPPEKGDDLYGLAISGGGIRSASFGLGVMQALKRRGVLKVMDYLSTVSGGGYIGSSLTWWLSRRRTKNGKEEAVYGLGDNDLFPFGQKYKGYRVDDDELPPNAILDFIRQNGNYLTNGPGLVSLGAVALGSMSVSLLLYLTLLTVMMVVVLGGVGELLSEVSLESVERLILFNGLVNIGEPGIDRAFSTLFFLLFETLLVMFIVVSMLFSVVPVVNVYRIRIRTQVALSWFVVGAFVCLFLGLVPVADELLQRIGPGAFWAGVSTILGLFIQFPQSFRQTQGESKKGILSILSIVTSTFLLIGGLMLGAYLLAKAVHASNVTLVLTLALVAVAVFCGCLVNLNYLGIHSVYRDQLMGTFLPNRRNVKQNKWGLATEANDALIEEMCQPPNQRPYHLINTNIILVDSPTSMFRSQGGDNFILSPLYCGSDATGWRRSDKYMKKKYFLYFFLTKERGGMTLPTAMAISGAAVNPYTGVGGKGLTRNRVVSMLMSLLDLRLGYWAPHPKYERAWLLPPSFVYPGLKSGLLKGGLHESGRFVQLTDGGHFENLALYELIRRKLKLIIVCDGGADPDFHFGDLANAVERVKVDFGVKIRFDYKEVPKEDEEDPQKDEVNSPKRQRESSKDFGLKWLLPCSAGDDFYAEKYRLAQRGFAVGAIWYPGDPADAPSGTLLYLKTTLTPGLPPDIYGYKSANPTFPDQTTADQFFDEAQFEAYRELGYQLGKQLLKVNEEEKWIPVP